MSRTSVQQLKRELKARSAKLKANARTALESAAQNLASEIRARAPIKSGNLARSVEAVPHGDGWRVQAGGDLTTREVRRGSGKPYDYSRAIEFGTVEQRAEPFFFTTFRRKKSAIKRRVTRDLVQGVVD